MAERYVRNVEARGSIPLTSTMGRTRTAAGEGPVQYVRQSWCCPDSIRGGRRCQRVFHRGLSVCLGWAVPAWVITRIRSASSIAYRTRPPPVHSYCHCGST